jgi:F-type H+-transporting ATPase subunit delta
MAETATLARPYARAAFEFALDGDALDAWSEMLGTAAALCAEDKVQDLVDAPGLTAAARAEHFISLIDPAPTDAMKNFLRLLSDYKRLMLLPEISEAYLLMKANQEQSVELEVTSAYEIDAGQARELAEAMGRKLKRQVNVHTEVDRDLIGGALIRTGDLVIDGTVRGKLGKLAESMHG